MALFQVTWFAAVRGGADGIPWLGPLVLLPTVGIHLTLSHNRSGEAKLLLAAGIIGFLFDTLLAAAGLFQPAPYLLPAPYSPLWMVCLWPNFAATLNVSLVWLRGRYLSALLLGMIGGPLAYGSGARLGGTAVMPTAGGLFAVAVGWGILTPLLVRLAACLAATDAPRNDHA